MHMLVTRKRKIFISKLTTDDGVVLTKHKEKEQNIFDFYNNLLGKNIDREVTVNLSELDMPNIFFSNLESSFSEEEVWKTINSLPSDKAPSHDGFTSKFYKVCWQTIKMDIMAAVTTAWSRKFSNFELLNSAFITLVPKKVLQTSKILDPSAWCMWRNHPKLLGPGALIFVAKQL